jgi:hypothetical protein
MLPPAYLRQKLAYPLPIRAALPCAPSSASAITCSPCRTATLIATPDWTRTAALLLEKAEVAVVSRQAHLALFCEARLDLKAMGSWR